MLYEIPDNWRWTTLGEVYTLYTGNSINEKVKKEKYTNLEVGHNFIATKDIGVNGDINYENGVKIFDYEKFKVAPANTTLLCIEGGSSGRKIGFVEENVCFGNKLCAFTTDKAYKKFEYYYLMSNMFYNSFALARHGLIGGVGVKVLRELPFPLPPVAEQQRIVNTIESLFVKLDSARDLVQSALEAFENRKFAILHKAFTGELTAKWREEHGVSLDSWEEKKLEEICEKITCGKTPTKDISDNGEIPFLKVYNIINNKVEFEYKPQFISTEIQQTKLKSSILVPNDVIMNIVGPPLRKIAIIPDDYPSWSMNQAIVRFRAKEKLHYKYLYYCLVYPKTLKEVIADTRGMVGQANISVTQSRSLIIPVPTLDEQTEIVRILDTLLTKEQQAYDLYNLLEKIDLMKKSILARAFRGELGTNNASDDDSITLLQNKKLKSLDA
ncbi:MAG: hypothetical protein ATN35_04675 [Epulopiscium sp. Nele67-Bin004]|nr:MAG: hypothetical protein ATN35_04675 [Epulopiscium sp. Nele67-Bin004]